jgi:MFS family permease
MTMMMTIFSMPFLMQRGLGMSAVTTAGLVATMQAVTVAMTLIGGWLYDRTRSPWLCVVGLSCVAGGLTILGLDPSGMDIVTLFILIVIMGFGSGIFLTTNNTRIMSALSPENRGFASGMLETTRQYGHTLGVAVATIGLSGVIGGAVTSETNPAVLEGFALSAAVTAAITWVGVALAAYPIWSRSARISDSSDVVDPSPLGLAVARRTARG